MAGDSRLLARLDELLDVGALLLFRKIRADGFDYGKLFRSCKRHVNGSLAFHCEMDDSLEHWRYQTLNRQGTRKLEQLQRKLERDFPGAAFLRITQPDLITQAIACVRDTRVERLEDDILRTGAYFSFYNNYALEAVQAGEAGLFAIVVDGRVRAALFGLQAAGVFHGTLLGADAAGFGKYSLGIQCLFLAAQYRHGQGDRIYSLGPGNGEYKARFRAVPTAMTNITRSNSLLGAGATIFYQGSFPFKDQIKHQVRRFRDHRKVS